MAATPEPLVYRVDNIDIDAMQACIRRNGDEVHLKPKTFRVLLHLIANRDRLVAKEELMDLFWKDSPVTDDALTQCIAEIRRALGDNPRSPTYIKTIPRVGFRFVGVVSDQREEEIPVPSPRRKIRPIWIAAGATLVVSIAAAALWTTTSRPSRSLTGKPQIAIVRFENRSGQADLDWLREGLPEMLATTLSRSRSLDVISREQLNARSARLSSSGLEGALTLARAMRAQFLVVGSFSKLGDSMRVDIRVYQAASGALVTSEDINMDRQDRLLTQIDFLALRLAARIAPAEPNQDRRALGSLMTENLEAYRYYTLGLEKADEYRIEDAVAMFEKALALDPQFVMASARIGYTYALPGSMIVKGRPYLEKAFRMSDRLPEKDRRHIVAWYAIANQDYAAAIRYYSELITEYPNEVEAYFRLGSLLRGESRHEEAVEVLQKGMALDPEDPVIPNALAAVYSEMGRHEEAIAMANRYVALSPSAANAYDSLGLAYQTAGQFDRALEAYAKAVEVQPDFTLVDLHRQIVYGQTGRLGEVIRIAEQLDKHYTSHYTNRAWEQAAFYAWKYGRVQQAESLLNRQQAHHEDWEYVYPLPAGYFLGQRTTHRENPIPGRGARWGQRHYLFYLAQMEQHREDRILKLQQMLRWRIGWGEADPLEDTLADAYMEAGRTEDAITEYERALKVFPGMALAHFHLAQAYQNKGLNAAAQAQLRACLEIWKHADPDLPPVAVARQTIEARQSIR